ncbi:MAG: hypothetical protein EXX96DRAFT_590404 [Benjaminiella poitrasii]|nr:MAG: hypothetical protein EXX96DRAFT_590404 [Benjaminiella poitrasii]
MNNIYTNAFSFLFIGSYCNVNQLDNNSLVACTNCINNFGSNNSNADQALITNSQQKPETKSSNKRGYKSHVPSACINCKTAHLACDVSRPCKRCISLKKTDTCQDIQHKKRGRPTKRQETKNDAFLGTSYEILYGTIQTPAISAKKNNTNSNKNYSTSVISFVQEPIESFKSPQPNIDDSNNNNKNNDDDNTPLMLPAYIITNSPHELITTPSNNSLPQQLVNNTTPLTMILSMEVCCARIPDDTIQYWGYYSQELAHRSLYDFISPKDNDRLAQLHRLLIDNVLINSNNNNDHYNRVIPNITERSTSVAFRQTDLLTLCRKANGARSFADTIHIRKRSGEFELYKMIVYVGGGLGADLNDPSTFSRLYIVSQFKKHDYEVIEEENSYFCTQPTTNTTTTATSITNTPTTSDELLFAENPFTNQVTSNKLDFQDSILLDSLFSKQETTTSFQNQQDKIAVPPSNLPKIHVAPITAVSTKPNQLLFQRFFPSSNTTNAAAYHKRKLSTTTAISSPITHPTQQYFLQTSSSTLNAAASAAVQQSKFRQQQPNILSLARENNKRMEEMSIRSLLC